MKNIKEITFLIIFTTAIFNVKAQYLTKKFVDNKVKMTFNVEEDYNNSLYLIDNVPFTPEGAEIELSKYLENELAGVNYISMETLSKKNRTIFCAGIIQIFTINCIDNNCIKTKLKKSKRMFCLREIFKIEPVLIVNGEQISHLQCYKTLKTIDISDIQTIYIIEQSVSTKKWGKNAKHGLVEINTKGLNGD